jgi:hypothetical protein
MKLRVVPASTGVQWLKLGIQTFFKQPLALCGLFFMFLALVSVIGMIPYVGGLLALVLVPGATAGLMAAAREASEGRFPMPSILLSVFRSSPTALRNMLVLGLIYAISFLGVLGLSALIDGGQLAQVFLLGNKLTEEMRTSSEVQLANLVTMALSLPLSLMFWHAPSLVHWHGVSPVKSLFFSLVACLRNFWALVVFGLAWCGVLVGVIVIFATLASILGNVQAVAVTLYPAAMLLVATFFVSVYFTFRDSFEAPPGETTP